MVGHSFDIEQITAWTSAGEPALEVPEVLRREGCDHYFKKERELRNKA